MEWKNASESKPKQGDRVLLKIKWEDTPVVGYWGVGEWEACLVNHKVECTNFCYGGNVERDFESDEVTHYCLIENIPQD